MPNKVFGKATNFQVSIASVFTNIPALTGVTPMAGDVAVNSTEELNPTGNVVAKYGGLWNEGTVEITYNYDPSDATQQYLETKARAVSTESFKIVRNTPTTPNAAFSGIISRISSAALNANNIEVKTATIEITGAVTLS